MSNNFKDYRNETRQNWGVNQEANLSKEQLQIGCLLRIADATEKMASNYTQLQNDVDYYKKRAVAAERKIEQLKRSIAAYKANYTRLKKRLGNQI